jgi:ketosteroid isomerase-like protein
MQHRVRPTGRTFKSEWALVVEARDGRILSWKIFEDTAAFQAAYV